MNIYVVRIKSTLKEIRITHDIVGVYTDEDLAYECINNEIEENPFIEDLAYFDIDYMKLDERTDENIFLIGD